MKRRYVYFNILLVVIALVLPCPFLQFGQYTQGRYTSLAENTLILSKFKYEVPSFKEFEKYLQQFSVNCSLLASLYELGKVGEYNGMQEVFPIYNMVLSTGYSKPIIVFLAGIYASDLYSPLALMHSFTQMTTRTKKLGRLLPLFDYHFIPLVNPAGYEYAYKNGKKGEPINWQKNMRRFREGKAVNILHNFDSNFRVISNLDDHYGGEEPFSELESIIIRDYIMEIRDDIAAVFLLFSSSKNNLLSYPSDNGVDNNSWIVQEQLAVKASKIDSRTHFNVVSAEEFDGQGGRMDDWLLKTLQKSAVINIHTDYTLKDEALRNSYIEDILTLLENLVIQLYQDEHNDYYNYRRISQRSSYNFPWRRI